MKKDKHMFVVAPKGYAIIAAIDSGLVRKNEDGSYDTCAFDKFWDALTDRVTMEVKKKA